LFYERFECGVILKEGVSDFFEVQTGVRQGCILSPLLFLILIDYVARIANEGSRGGVQWGISSGRVEYLDDLDYADDLSWHALKLRFEIRPIRYGRLRAVWG